MIKKILFCALLSSLISGQYLLASEEAPSSANQNNINAVIDNKVPTGEALITWIKRMISDEVPTDKMLTEISTALINCTNPSEALYSCYNLYFKEVPLEQRFVENEKSLFVRAEKSRLRTELNQILEHNNTVQSVQQEVRRLELLKELLPCAELWRPYAVANKFLYLLKERAREGCVNTPPTPQIAEQWLAHKIGPQTMLEHLCYERAAQEILPQIYDRLIKKNSDKNDDYCRKFDLLNFGRRYIGIGLDFRTFPLSSETFTAEDELIALYKKHLCTLQAAADGKSNAYEKVLDPEFMKRASNDLLYYAAENYRWFLQERLKVLDAATEEPKNAVILGALYKRIAYLKELETQAPIPTTKIHSL